MTDRSYLWWLQFVILCSAAGCLVAAMGSLVFADSIRYGLAEMLAAIGLMAASQAVGIIRLELRNKL